MKEVKRYIADDGQIFEDEFACKNYEKRIALVEELKSAINDMAFSGMTKMDIEEMLLNGAETFGKILTKIVAIDKTL